MNLERKIFLSGLAAPFALAAFYIFGTGVLINSTSTHVGSAVGDVIMFVVLFVFLSPVAVFAGLAWLYHKYGIRFRKKLALWSALNLVMLSEMYFIVDNMSYDSLDLTVAALYVILAVPLLSGALSVIGYNILKNESENKQHLIVATYSALVVSLFFMAMITFSNR